MRETRWSQDPAQRRRWSEELESSGVDAVRIKLAQHDGGSAGAIAIGLETAMTKGFAEEWLNCKDQQRAAEAAVATRKSINLAVIGTIAAIVAAVASVVVLFQK